MAELTIPELRDKIKIKIDAAKLQVQKFEEQLQTIDALIQENEITNSKEMTSSDQQQILNVNDYDENSVGKVITETIRSIDKTAMFDVPRIVQMVRTKFPNISYPELSKKASAKASRLEKRGEIKIVREGGGRTPHVFKRVNKE